VLNEEASEPCRTEGQQAGWAEVHNNKLASHSAFNLKSESEV
jgi:hypothetical protein